MSADPWASNYDDALRVTKGAAWLRGLAEAVARTSETDAMILRAAANLSELHAERLRAES